MLIMNGFDVLIVDSYPVKCKRSWKERLFSLPFNPFKRYKVDYMETLEDGEFYVAGNNLIMNRYTYKLMREYV